MKKYCIIVSLAFGLLIQGHAQNYATRNGMIRISSDGPKEKTEAVNRTVNAALLTSTGDFFLKFQIKSFTFENAMMQERFNKDYMESDKYPEATLLAKVTNVKDINFGKDSTYPAVIEGKLTIHGQTRLVKQNGTFEVRNGAVTAKTKFDILLADYAISVPDASENNLSKTIEMTLEVLMNEMKK